MGNMKAKNQVLPKFNHFALKIKGLDDKTLMFFCKFLPLFKIYLKTFFIFFQLHSILFHGSTHILYCIRMLHYGSNVNFQSVG